MSRVVAVTMGDLAGVGPEVVAKALLKRPRRDAVFLIVGDAQVLDATCRRLRIRRRFKEWDGKSKLSRMPRGVYVHSITRMRPSALRMGRPRARLGDASVQYIRFATQLAMSGAAHALVTAPISKEAMHRAGHAYEGHTDMLAKLTHSRAVRMMFLGPKMRVILSTVHIALRDVPRAVTTDGVFHTIRLGGEALRDMGLGNPRIAVCGLNPHAGEAGAFGREDECVVQPAVQAARRRGWRVTGPLPSDSFFWRASRDKIDLVVAMYHDQGLIPFKMLHFDSGVNTTVGLPFPRISPDHGTAYDIAGKGLADPTSMQEALRWAIRLCRKRR